MSSSLDLVAERDISLRMGLSRQAWPVAADYRVEDGVIRPVGVEDTLYFPMARSRLPHELARIALGDVDAALNFVKKWGLLGHWAIVPSDRRVNGDPLDFFFGHAETVRTWLQLIHKLQRADDESFASQADWFKLGPVAPSSTSTAPSLDYWVGHRRRFMSFIGDENPAFTAVTAILSGNLTGVHPQVGVEKDVQERPRRFLRTFFWRGLVEAIYLHLWTIVEGGKPLKKCSECSGFFVQTDARQRFCPPDQSVKGGRGAAESLCAQRHRQKEFRKNKLRQSAVEFEGEGKRG